MTYYNVESGFKGHELRHSGPSALGEDGH
jgi:hypothetical protein